jgi:hypothetical protein
MKMNNDPWNYTSYLSRFGKMTPQTAYSVFTVLVDVITCDNSNGQTAESGKSPNVGMAMNDGTTSK